MAAVLVLATFLPALGCSGRRAGGGGGGDDDDSGGDVDTMCCTLRRLCSVCCCDGAERTIAEAGDETACEQFLDEDTYACGREGGSETDALADCASGRFDPAEWDPVTPCCDEDPYEEGC